MSLEIGSNREKMQKISGHERAVTIPRDLFLDKYIAGGSLLSSQTEGTSSCVCNNPKAATVMQFMHRYKAQTTVLLGFSLFSPCFSYV